MKVTLKVEKSLGESFGLDFIEKEINCDDNIWVADLLEIFNIPFTSEVLVTVNKEFCRGNIKLEDGDRIAVHPMLIGG